MFRALFGALFSRVKKIQFMPTKHGHSLCFPGKCTAGCTLKVHEIPQGARNLCRQIQPREHLMTGEILLPLV